MRNYTDNTKSRLRRLIYLFWDDRGDGWIPTKPAIVQGRPGGPYVPGKTLGAEITR